MKKKIQNLYTSCAFGRICSSLLVFFTLKQSTAGDGLLVKTLIIPLGNDTVISPVIFTIHLEENENTRLIATHSLPSFNTKTKDTKSISNKGNMAL